MGRRSQQLRRCSAGRELGPGWLLQSWVGLLRPRRVRFQALCPSTLYQKLASHMRLTGAAKDWVTVRSIVVLLCFAALAADRQACVTWPGMGWRGRESGTPAHSFLANSHVSLARRAAGRYAGTAATAAAAAAALAPPLAGVLSPTAPSLPASPPAVRYVLPLYLLYGAPALHRLAPTHCSGRRYFAW